MNSEIAAKTQTQVTSKEVTFIMLSLYLTFTGILHASEWGLISESGTDLSNNILRCEEQFPSYLYSPQQHLVPSPNTFPAIISFVEVKSIITDIPSKDKEKYDVYI